MGKYVRDFTIEVTWSIVFSYGNLVIVVVVNVQRFMWHYITKDTFRRKNTGMEGYATGGERNNESKMSNNGTEELPQDARNKILKRGW